jgi:hypothetical protein
MEYKILEHESKGVRAKGCYIKSNGTFVVLKDSCAVYDTKLKPSFYGRGYEEKRKEFIDTGKLKKELTITSLLRTLNLAPLLQRQA